MPAAAAGHALVAPALRQAKPLERKRQRFALCHHLYTYKTYTYVGVCVGVWVCECVLLVVV